MAKKKNIISYANILLILFGLIAMFLICRNLLVLKKNILLDATYYGYEQEGNKYIASYFYEYKGKTYHIKREESIKPKPSSVITISCSKKDASRCIVNIEKYMQEVYISIFILIPVITFVFLDLKRHRIKNDTGNN